MNPSVTIPVEDPSRAGEVRRAAVALAAELGFSAQDQGRVAIVATEAATNLVKHARGGEVLLRGETPAEGGGVEVLALDRGPGIADLGECLRDGFSTTGTAGIGLGGMRRLADVFDITSVVPFGTVLLAKVRPAKSVAAGWRLGVACLPVATETECGDRWAVKVLAGKVGILVVDGLGHGPQAALAANVAVRTYEQAAQTDPTEVIHALHAALRPTRGAAVAVAELDPAARTLRFAGIGNVAALLLGPDLRHGIVSHNGTVGHTVRKIQAFDHPWPPQSHLVLHSDGLSTQWDLTRDPGLLGRHPALLAGTLYRDHRRTRDDVTVLAVCDP